MIRVSGLRNQLAAGAVKAPADGMSPAEQLAAIREQLAPMLDQAHACWTHELAPRLREHGISVLSLDELKGKQRKLLRRHFKAEILPVLTPLAFDPGHPFPHISNLSLNLAVVVEDPEHGRALRPRQGAAGLPSAAADPERGPGRRLRAAGSRRAQLVDLRVDSSRWSRPTSTCSSPGSRSWRSTPSGSPGTPTSRSRRTRPPTCCPTMMEVVGQRYFGNGVRLEVDARMPTDIREILLRNLGLPPTRSTPGTARSAWPRLSWSSLRSTAPS